MFLEVVSLSRGTYVDLDTIQTEADRFAYRLAIGLDSWKQHSNHSRLVQELNIGPDPSTNAGRPLWNFKPTRGAGEIMNIMISRGRKIRKK